MSCNTMHVMFEGNVDGNQVPAAAAAQIRQKTISYIPGRLSSFFFTTLGKMPAPLACFLSFSSICEYFGGPRVSVSASAAILGLCNPMRMRDGRVI